jgi:hypothetical protein
MSAPANAAYIQIIDTTGPLVGATIEYTDLDDNEQDVYSDPELSTSLGPTLNGSNASDSKGRFPAHFLDPSSSYKRVIKTSAGATWLTQEVVQTAGVSSDSVAVVSSIAELQATSFGASPPLLVAVIANSSAGDGGGSFRLDAADTVSADNGATIIIDASSNRWKRQTQQLLFDIAVADGWRLPSAHTPTLYAGSTAVASATSTGGVLLADVTTPADAMAAGFRGSPIVAADGATTIAASHMGKSLYHTSGATPTVTIDSNANLALPVGFVFAIDVENGAGTLTLAITTDTLRWGSSTGSRTVPADSGLAVKKVASTTWRVIGAYGAVS